MVASAVGALVGGVGAGLAGSLFSGGGPSIPNPAANLPTSFQTPDISISRTGKHLTLTRDNDILARLGLLNTAQANQIGGLLSRVAPGISELRRTRLQGLENIRRRTVGDIRDNLARRRVLGSSFAQDAIVRAEREFAQQADEIRATSFLQELDLTNRLIQQQSDVLRNTVLTELEQSNFDAQLTANFANRTQTVLAQATAAQAQLAASAQAGLGQFFSPFINQFGSAISGAVTNFFNPSPTVRTDAAGRILGGI